MLKHIWSYRFDKIFDSVAHLLEPDEVAVINSINRTDPASTNNPWIKKYIFPGGYILSLIQVMTDIKKKHPYGHRRGNHAPALCQDVAGMMVGFRNPV